MSNLQYTDALHILATNKCEKNTYVSFTPAGYFKQAKIFIRKKKSVP